MRTRLWLIAAWRVDDGPGRPSAQALAQLKHKDDYALTQESVPGIAPRSRAGPLCAHARCAPMAGRLAPFRPSPDRPLWPRAPGDACPAAGERFGRRAASCLWARTGPGL